MAASMSMSASQSTRLMRQMAGRARGDAQQAPRAPQAGAAESAAAAAHAPEHRRRLSTPSLHAQNAE
jgi:hypothetical protein